MKPGTNTTHRKVYNPKGVPPPYINVATAPGFEGPLYKKYKLNIGWDDKPRRYHFAHQKQQGRPVQRLSSSAVNVRVAMQAGVVSGDSVFELVHASVPSSRYHMLSGPRTKLRLRGIDAIGPSLRRPRTRTFTLNSAVISVLPALFSRGSRRPGRPAERTTRYGPGEAGSAASTSAT